METNFREQLRDNRPYWKVIISLAISLIGTFALVFIPNLKVPETIMYLLGSVHYIKGPKTGKLHPVDWGAEELQACLDEFEGDGAAMVRAYYALVEENVKRFQPDIIGHFDLVVKNNAGGRFFDETSSAYRAAALHALHTCIKAGCIVEVNTGGAYRGYREDFYPAAFLLEELARLGGKVTLNADAHHADGLCFGFDAALAQMKAAGIREVWMPKGNGFISKSLEHLPSR